MNFDIEKGFPLPDFNNKPVGQIYPYADMEPGDMWFIPCSDKVEAATVANRCRSALHRKRLKDISKEFVSRTFVHPTKGYGVGMFRLAKVS